MKPLKNLLEGKMDKLCGDWVGRKDSYEDDVCKILGMNKDTVRYWDSTWNNKFIELKKGKSRWLDLVRYSEILLKVNEDAKKKTITLFLIPNNDKSIIQEIICVDTDKLICKLSLTEEKAKMILSINKDVPRSLNAQASLGITDIRKIADFIIK